MRARIADFSAFVQNLSVRWCNAYRFLRQRHHDRSAPFMCIVITRIYMKPASFTASVKRCMGFNQMFVITDVIQASATWNSLWNSRNNQWFLKLCGVPRIEVLPHHRKCSPKKFILSDQINLKSGFLHCIIYCRVQTAAV